MAAGGERKPLTVGIGQRYDSLYLRNGTVRVGGSTSKAAVIGLTRVLARELGEHNIAVNAVAPGQTLSLDDVPQERRQRYESIAQSRSLKRIQMPRDLVGPVVFLCCPTAICSRGRPWW